MKKKLLMALLASAMMLMALSFAAYADDDEEETEIPIESVSFEAYVADDTSIGEGATFPEFVILNDEDLFDMTWEEPSSAVDSVSSAKNAKTFTLTFTSTSSDYVFTTDTVVNATGVQELVSKKVKDDGETLVVKVECYVYYQLSPPEVTNEDSALDNPTASKIKFEKNGANTVEYYIVSTNSSGDSLTKHGTTTSSYVSISSLTKEYSDTAHENGYEDKVVVAFWIRAKDVKNCSNPYIAPSEWVSVGDEDPDAEIFDYETWGEFIADKGMSSSKSEATIGPSEIPSLADSASSSAETGPQGSSTSSSNTTTANGWWDGEGTTWYYKLATGSNATGWLEIGGCWYYLDPGQDGLVVGGLQSIDGYTYYFSTGESAAYGVMLTGWQTIGETTYFFRQSTGSGGEPEGAMIVGKTVAIDGVNYVFDSTGALTGEA